MVFMSIILSLNASQKAIESNPFEMNFQSNFPRFSFMPWAVSEIVNNRSSSLELNITGESQKKVGKHVVIHRQMNVFKKYIKIRAVI